LYKVVICSYIQIKDNWINNLMQKESIQLDTYTKSYALHKWQRSKLVNNLIYGNLTRKIALTIYFKTKITTVKTKHHMSRTCCKHFRSIWRLSKKEFKNFQDDSELENSLVQRELFGQRGKLSVKINFSTR